MARLAYKDPYVKVFCKGDNIAYAVKEEHYAEVLTAAANSEAIMKSYRGIYGDMIHVRGRDIQTINYWSREATDFFDECMKEDKAMEVLDNG